MNTVPKRVGFKNINVNETVEFTLSVKNTNKWGKEQYSGFINGEHYYLPTHQMLVDKLGEIPRGSKVKVKRLTLGNAKEACEYDIQVIGGPTGVTVKVEEPSPIADSDDMLKTVISCLKNNCSSGQIIMVLKKEYGDDVLNKMGL